MKDFWQDIFDIEWHKWKTYTIFIFVSVCASAALGAYFAEWFEYTKLF